MEKNAQKIADLARENLNKSNKSRIIIAIAGAPGSGKSSLAEQAVQILNTSSVNQAALLAMDGFHYDDQVLEILGRRESKGAADTFDADGLYYLLQRLKNNTDEMIAVPVFDRSIEIARAGAWLIYPQTSIILCEGNYLLLNSTPWNRLKPLFDLSIMLQVPVDELEQRLTRRWQDLGLSDKEIQFKVEKNDLPNGLMMFKNSVQPDLYLDN